MTPGLRVVAGGTPTEAELAALVLAVTAAASAQTSHPAGRSRGGWADRSAELRRPLRGGSGAWRHHPNTH